MGSKAVEKTHNINNAFGPGTDNKCTVHWWLKKFCKGDKSLEIEKRSGPPLVVDVFYPMECSQSGSSGRGILQARILEWGAISFSRGSFWPRNQTHISCIAGRLFSIWTIREAKWEQWLKLILLTPIWEAAWELNVDRSMIVRHLKHLERWKSLVRFSWSEAKWKSLSHVRLFVTPWTIWSMEFSRPECWSG